MRFLKDAHRRGVLRQEGAVYQFRHIELQHRLANAPGKIGSYFDVQDVNGHGYRVTLVKVIDPAQGVDQYTPGNAKRFVGAVIKIKARSGTRGIDGNRHMALVCSNAKRFVGAVIKIKARSGTRGIDGNRHMALVCSNGETFPADVADIAGYANFGVGMIQLVPGKTVRGAITFQVPDGVKVHEVQWIAGSGFGSMARWDVRS